MELDGLIAPIGIIIEDEPIIPQTFSDKIKVKIKHCYVTWGMTVLPIAMIWYVQYIGSETCLLNKLAESRLVLAKVFLQ